MCMERRNQCTYTLQTNGTLVSYPENDYFGPSYYGTLLLYAAKFCLSPRRGADITCQHGDIQVAMCMQYENQ